MTPNQQTPISLPDADMSLSQALTNLAQQSEPSQPHDSLLLENIPLYRQQVLGPRIEDPSGSYPTDYIDEAIAAAPAIPYSDIAIWGYVGAVLLVAAFALLAFLHARNEKGLASKISSALSQAGWGILFGGGMIGMSMLGTAKMLTGSIVFYIAALLCAFFAGALVFMVRFRDVLRSSRETSLAVALRISAMSADPASRIPPGVSSSPAANGISFSSYLPGSAQRTRGDRLRRILWRVSKSAAVAVSLSLIVSTSAVFISAFVSFVMLEVPANASLFSIGDPYLYAEFLVLLGTTTGIWFIFQRKGAALLITPSLALIYGIAEYFVESFKKAAIMPADLASAGTGLAVAGGYTYEITGSILFCIALLALFATLTSFVKDPLQYVFSAIAGKMPWTGDATAAEALSGDAGVPDAVVFGSHYSFAFRFTGRQTLRRVASARKRKTALVIAKASSSVLCVLLGILLIWGAWSGVYATDWEDEGVELDVYLTAESFHEYGIIPSFMNSLQMQNLEAPARYTTQKAQDLQDAFARAYDTLAGNSPQRVLSEQQFARQRPNVVVVMNESFSDLSYLNGLNAGYEGPQFFKNSQAYAKGKLSVSVYGGGTCNTEFEMLVETPLAYVGSGLNPYVMYDLKDVNSAVKNFSSYGYDTTAIHPEEKTNWKRSSIYPSLGFDQFLDKKSFSPDALTHRDMIADSETYKQVMDVLRDNDDPQFVWDLTMANHGGYDTGLLPSDETLHYPFGEWVDDRAAGITNEYVSMIKLADDEVAEFMRELDRFAEPTVVVFFGDHHPGFTDWYTETIFADQDELVRRELAYQTDYAIWANYDIAGWDGQCHELSMNAGQLMSYTMNLIGAPITDYEKAQYVSRNWAISANVFGVMDEFGIWHDIEETKKVAGTYERALDILDSAAATGRVLHMSAEDPASVEEKLVQDRIIFDAMRWVTYMNFQEKVAN